MVMTSALRCWAPIDIPSAFADPCPDSEAVFARGTPEHRTSSSSRAPCLSGSETPQRQIHHCWSQREVTIARTPAPRTGY